jgi:RNA polymerase sigma-54 factor
LAISNSKLDSHTKTFIFTMKAALQLKTGQSLTMTPQMQQAIRLLQLSASELDQEIQDCIEANMMLELVEDEPLNDTGHLSNLSHDEGLVEYDVPPDEVSQSIDWQESNYEGFSLDLEQVPEVETLSLRRHLLWQLNLLSICEPDIAIGIAIIDAIDLDGRLVASLEEISVALENSGGKKPNEDEICSVLKLIQTFDPLGVGARTLSECLLIQLGVLSSDVPFLEITKKCVRDFLEVIGERSYEKVYRSAGVSRDDFGKVLELIRSLSPRPGNLYGGEKVEYVVPDVFVFCEKGRWIVELNQQVIPRLGVNKLYSGMLDSRSSDEMTSTLRKHLQEARFLIKSLESRNDTLLAVSMAIVERQKGFLTLGEQAMQPLVMNEIAEVVNMHESTVSRVTTHKYMHTPRGIFELKYFFSSQLSSDSGKVSSVAIRAVIKKLVAAENKLKPLSDSKLSETLSAHGIQVARRTVAKYRDSLSIPSSSDRRKFG